MARPDSRRRRVSSAAVLIALTCMCSGSAESAEPNAEVDLAPVLAQKSVLVRTKDDRFVEGKPVGAFADTLVLKQGNRKSSWLVHVRTAEIDHVWAPHPAPAHKALVLGIGGVVGGALLEIGLGSDCPECSIDAGQVLESAAVEGAVDAAFGAILGLFGGGFKQLVPAVSEGGGVEPYARWGASVAVGGVDGTGNGVGDGRGFARTTAWITGSPASGWGLEYGTLTGSDETFRSVLYDSVGGGLALPGYTGDFRWRDRWGYAAFQHRWRALRGTARPELTCGFGSYFERGSSSSTLRDSVGVEVSHRSGVSNDAWFGLNLGTGVTFGKGALQPGIDARAHWAISPAIFWYSLALKADWH